MDMTSQTVAVRDIVTPQDILEALELTRLSVQHAARQVIPADPIEAQLLNLLGQEPLHVDDLRERASLPIEQVTASLTMMELKGLVRQVGGMHYVAVREEPGQYAVDPASNP